MTPTLIALAGKSRAGKGTCATYLAELAAADGFTSFERQLSDNGKWHLARIFFPEISRVDAVAWFEEQKRRPDTPWVSFHDGSRATIIRDDGMKAEMAEQPLQKFIQHGLQEGGRDIFGEHFWTDMILPISSAWTDTDHNASGYFWEEGFFDEESGLQAEDEQGETWTDLAIISDLRQANEAERVRQCGGLVVEIHRPDIDDGYVTGKDHITERGLSEELVDYHLHSTGDLDYFREIVTEMYQQIVRPRLEENR